MGKKSSDTALLWKLALRIKELRESKGLTQEVFFNDTGIHVGRIERAQRNISVTTLCQICSYLNVSFTEFFDGLDMNAKPAKQKK